MGPQGVVDIDPVTGTPRTVAKLNGFLTGPSDASPRAIAIGYLRRHAAAFGLDGGDVASLRLTRDYTDARGTTHLIWAQTFDGIQALDNGVYANVAKDGRLVNVMGSPVADLSVPTVQPGLSARGAVSAALANAGVPARRVPAKAATHGADRRTRFAGGADDARLVLFTEGPGVTRLAWRVTADASSTELYDYVIDASNGKVLYRQNTVDFVTTGFYVWESAPHMNAVCPTCPPAAGAQDWHIFNYNWGTDHPLSGGFATVYTDADDDGQPDAPSPNCPECGYTNSNTSVGRNDGPAWFYPFSANPGGLISDGGEEGSDCSDTFPQCAWYRHDPGYEGWRDNIGQSSTQVYWYVNTFHDWLKDSAIGFNSASGAFEGGDRVEAQTFNGADTGPVPGTPDSMHVNTATMSTQRDGVPPTMQLSLFDNPGTKDTQTNAGDDASLVYHEYAHGLSSRLVTDPSGTSALRSFQARAMGEGWGDWYALDYLEGSDLERDDTALDGQMNLGIYTMGGNIHSLRTQGLDCRVGSAATAYCPGGFATGPGGYTLGDMGKVADGPEIHADGEIWGETVWDLRHNWIRSSGLTTAAAEDQIRTIVTDGMRVSPPDPSMLDERNAILQATKLAFPSDKALYWFVWRTFAHRGMGYFASDRGSSDTSPTEDFSTPPGCRAPATCGRLTGVVVDADTGKPVANATVAVRGFGDLVATTNGAGRYVIGRVPPHRYELVSASRTGFEPGRRANVAVGTGTTTLDLKVRRDWAATDGGARVKSFDGPDLSRFGCGPSAAFDLARGSGWSSTTGPKQVVVKLPRPIDVRGFAVDPGATCGHDDSASTRALRLEASPDGRTFTTVATPHFRKQDNHRLSLVAPGGQPKNVRFVRATMLRNQSSDVGAGRSFMDLSELEVYGKPPEAAPAAGDGSRGQARKRDNPQPVITHAEIPDGQTIRLVSARGFKVSARLSEPGNIRGALVVSPEKADELGTPRRIATGKVRFPAPSTQVLAMNLTSGATSAIKHERSLRVTATLRPTSSAFRRGEPVWRVANLPH